MTLVTRITEVVKAIGADIKALKGRVLVLENKPTSTGGVDESHVQSTVNTKVEESINTLKGELGTLVAPTVTSKVNESIDTLKGELATLVTPTITAEINKVVDGAPETFNTLKEIADYIEQDKTGASAMTTSINNRLRFDEQQSLTEAQQANVLNSLGLTDVDLVTAYTTAVNS